VYQIRFDFSARNINFVEKKYSFVEFAKKYCFGLEKIVDFFNAMN
jgi:hypothetical protein